MSNSATAVGTSEPRKPQAAARSVTSQYSLFSGSVGGRSANPVSSPATGSDSYSMNAFRGDANQPFSPFRDANDNFVSGRGTSNAAAAINRVAQLFPNA